jgi:hypothetical protein
LVNNAQAFSVWSQYSIEEFYKMNKLIYIIVLSIGVLVGYFEGFPGVIGMISGAAIVTLISYDKK